MRLIYLISLFIFLYFGLPHVMAMCVYLLVVFIAKFRPCRMSPLRLLRVALSDGYCSLNERTNAKCESDFPNKTINVAKKLHSNLPYKSSGGECVGVKSSLELLTRHLHLSLIEQKLVTMVPLNWQNDKN